MSSLSIEEALKVSESFLISLYSAEVYKRWTELKCRMDFATERDFVTWIMDWIEQQQEQESQDHEYMDQKSGDLHYEENNSLVETDIGPIPPHSAEKHQEFVDHENLNTPSSFSYTVVPSKSKTVAGQKRAYSHSSRAIENDTVGRRSGLDSSVIVDTKSDYNSTRVKQERTGDSGDDDISILSEVVGGEEGEGGSISFTDQHEEKFATNAHLDDRPVGSNNEMFDSSNIHQDTDSSAMRSMISPSLHPTHSAQGPPTVSPQYSQLHHTHTSRGDEVATGSRDDGQMAAVMTSRIINHQTATSRQTPPSQLDHDQQEAAGAAPVCPYCGRSFYNPASARRHINDVHLRVKAHKCRHCELSFAQSGTLKAHVSAVHQGQKR